ncbi:MaoC/PaaZ C-terminal domain-containing protein [Microlunatus sp. Y2014]|uniref:MaoC/PaaZ C-terminal domain-containing protein n=1 Tax=Microlunatus sp. Y2014 TaxID=3418488 RepID=UPI003DA7A14D
MSDTVEKGTVLPVLTRRVTRTDLVRYAGASGDFNPIHHSDHVATSMGLPGVIAHGMFTMGVAARVVTDWLGGTDGILGYQARFARPVVVPDTDDGVELVVTGTVSEVTDDTVTVMLDARCGEEKVLGAARMVVRRG